MKYLANVYGLEYCIEAATPHDAARLATERSLMQGCFDIMDRTIFVDVWHRGDDGDDLDPDFSGSFRVDLKIEKVTYTVTKEDSNSDD